MPSEFGDESGEKFCDWLMDIGQQAGQEAMHAAARKLSVALKHTKGDLGVDEAEPKWARLNLDELSKMEGYDSIKQILDKQLEDAGVEHSFFVDDRTGQESLLFKHEDASKVDRVFDELIEDVDRSLERADTQLSRGEEPAKTQTKETSRALGEAVCPRAGLFCCAGSRAKPRAWARYRSRGQVPGSEDEIG